MTTKKPVRLKNEEYRSREYLYLSEVNSLLACAESGDKHRLRNSTLVLLIFRHGLRATEASNLKWDAISFEERKIFIRRAKNGIPGTHNLEGDEIEKLKELKENATTRYVFVGERGKQMTTAAIAKVINRLGVSAGFTFKVHPHQLRHACGYHMAGQNSPLYEILAYLGHINVSSTMCYINLAGLPPNTIDWTSQRS